MGSRSGCCCLPCNHCKNGTWVAKKFWPMVKGCVLRTADSFNIWNYANLLTSLALINYYLTLAMSSGRFAYYVIQRNEVSIDVVSGSSERITQHSMWFVFFFWKFIYWAKLRVFLFVDLFRGKILFLGPSCDFYM